jgi:hypothetical protein
LHLAVVDEKIKLHDIVAQIVHKVAKLFKVELAIPLP